MIHHIVCFRFQPGTPAGAIAAAGAALQAMSGRIPEIRGVLWGPNLAPSATEYSHVLTVILDDMRSVARYLEHPVHRQVIAEHLAPIREARFAIDIEL
jgi:Stress responsive A/B Barrel Domain